MEPYETEQLDLLLNQSPKVLNKNYDAEEIETSSTTFNSTLGPHHPFIGR